MVTNRRSFLKAGSAAAFLGTVGLAGCNQFLGGGDTTDAGSWQYDPAALASSPNVAFASADYGTMYENRDELPESMSEGFEVDSDSPMGPGDIDHLVGVGGGSVALQTGQSSDVGPMSMFGSLALTGDIPRDELAAEMESDDSASEVGDYEGYTLYETSSFDDVGAVDTPGFGGSGAVALGDSAVVAGVVVERESQTDVTGRQTTEQMIDASAGNARRLSETSGPAQQLQSSLGDAIFSVGVEVDPEIVSTYAGAGGTPAAGGFDVGQYTDGFRAGGMSMDVGGDTSTFTFVAVYENGQRADEAAIDDAAEAMAPQMEGEEGIESISASRDGEVITVTVEGDTQTMFQAGQSTGSSFSLAPGPY